MVQPSCEVLLLQEHKLNGTKANELGRNLWPEAACYMLDADPGYTSNPNGAGRGGVCILVSPYLKHMIASNGFVRDNKAMWVTFSRTHVRKLGILNVYGPNYSYKRVRLWENLASILYPLHTSLIVGDWNM
jgi:hypothetical protein